MRWGRRMPRKMILISLLFLACCALAQQAPDQEAAPAPQNNDVDVKETAVMGCLSNASGDFTITDASGTQFHIAGNPGLDPYLGHEVSIGGTVAANDPNAPITVTEIKDLLNPAGPVANFSASDWRTSVNKSYGFSFSYPDTFKLLDEAELRKDSNFANATGAKALVSVEIPDNIYPGSNFRGGYFTVLANPNIGNGPACAQFGYADPSAVTSRAVNNVKYSQAVDNQGAAGTAYATYYLHAYENGLCYEVKFEVAAVNTGAYDLPCSIRLVSEDNKLSLLDSFLSRLTFSHPTLSGLSRSRPRLAKPSVTAFAPSSEPGNHSLEIKISWTTQGADYVRLKFDCSNGLVVTGASDYMECGTDSNRNFPPNGSAAFAVSNPKGKSPIPFVVSVEPFAGATGYPSQSKTLRVPVGPDPL